MQGQTHENIYIVFNIGNYDSIFLKFCIKGSCYSFYMGKIFQSFPPCRAGLFPEWSYGRCCLLFRGGALWEVFQLIWMCCQDYRTQASSTSLLLCGYKVSSFSATQSYFCHLIYLLKQGLPWSCTWTSKKYEIRYKIQFFTSQIYSSYFIIVTESWLTQSSYNYYTF
jgi:hypothetical protein